MANKKYIVIVGMTNSGKTTFNTVLQYKLLEEYEKRENLSKEIKLLSSFVVPASIDNNYKLLEQKTWPIDRKDVYKTKLDNKDYPDEIEIKEFSSNFLEALKGNKAYYSEVNDFRNYLISDSLIGVFLVLDSKILFDKKDYKIIDSNFSNLISYINNKEKLKQDNASTTALTTFKKSLFSLLKSNKEQTKTNDKLPKIAIIANKLELFSEPFPENILEERFANIYTESYKELQKTDYKFFNLYPIGKIERNIDGEVNLCGSIEPKNIFKPLVWLGVVDDYSTKIKILSLILLFAVIYSFSKYGSDYGWDTLAFSVIFFILAIKNNKLIDYVFILIKSIYSCGCGCGCLLVLLYFVIFLLHIFL